MLARTCAPSRANTSTSISCRVGCSRDIAPERPRTLASAAAGTPSPLCVLTHKAPHVTRITCGRSCVRYVRNGCCRRQSAACKAKWFGIDCPGRNAGRPAPFSPGCDSGEMARSTTGQGSESQDIASSSSASWIARACSSTEDGNRATKAPLDRLLLCRTACQKDVARPIADESLLVVAVPSARFSATAAPTVPKTRSGARRKISCGPRHRIREQGWCGCGLTESIRRPYVLSRLELFLEGSSLYLAAGGAVEALVEHWDDRAWRETEGTYQPLRNPGRERVQRVARLSCHVQRRHIYCRHGLLARHKKDEQRLSAERRVVHARRRHAQNVAIANLENHRLHLIAIVIGAKYDDHLFCATAGHYTCAADLEVAHLVLGEDGSLISCGDANFNARRGRAEIHERHASTRRTQLARTEYAEPIGSETGLVDPPVGCRRVVIVVGYASAALSHTECRLHYRAVQPGCAQECIAHFGSHLLACVHQQLDTRQVAAAMLSAGCAHAL
eukprot:scaffold120105_cov118-Phaeocystis_antarctica.AAC.5